MDQLAQRITEYAATVDEANKRTLDTIIIELMRDRGRHSRVLSAAPTPSTLRGEAIFAALNSYRRVGTAATYTSG